MKKQLEFKQNKVRGNLIRIGGFAPELIDRIMLPVVGMKEPYRYRNKAQFPIGADKDGNPVAGFMQRVPTVLSRSMTVNWVWRKIRLF